MKPSKNTSCLDSVGFPYFHYPLTTGAFVLVRDPDGAFAYRLEDIEKESGRFDDLSEDQQETYDYTDDFCRRLRPVEDRAVASEFALVGIRILKGGTCLPVLTEVEFKGIRS